MIQDALGPDDGRLLVLILHRRDQTELAEFLRRHARTLAPCREILRRRFPRSE